MNPLSIYTGTERVHYIYMYIMPLLYFMLLKEIQMPVIQMKNY